MKTATTSNIELCTRAQLELFGEGKLELADELIAPECVDHGAESGPSGDGRSSEGSGPDGIRGIVQWLRGAFPDLSYEVEDSFGDGDRVALRCRVSGTHQGEFLGRPGTGRRFAVEHIHLYRVRDGQIAEHWAARDDVGMMRQLGLAG